MKKLVVFTDLDGTLLHPIDHSWRDAARVLDRLDRLDVPVVPVTSRTRREVEHLRIQAGLRGPYVVEAGSAVFFPAAAADPSPPAMVRLGCTRLEAAIALSMLRERLRSHLPALSDLPVPEIVARTGLDHAAARVAADREFGEVILPGTVSFDEAAAATAGIGFRLVEGDRFWHLIGRNADKAAAVRVVLKQLCEGTDLISMALGNGASDAGVLELVDVPVVVPRESGPHPLLASRGWRVAPEPGARGWAAAVADVLDQLASRPAFAAPSASD
ncbi:MAG: HAD hydrolase family protein [Gemmatimonadetes bacterium]|nr:HAD hydrolase family protein [Gemmatimonadota bacterium]